MTTAERIRVANNDAVKRGGSLFMQVYPQLFDQRRRGKTLVALQRQVELTYSSPTAVTPEAAKTLYRRFCIIELIADNIDFMVPITKAKADAAVAWMNAPFNACTLEISRKMKEGNAYRRQDSTDVVRRGELKKLGDEVGIMVWNIWPDQSLLHHRAGLRAAIVEEVARQKDAKTIGIGLFRSSAGAGADIVNAALRGCAHPLGKAAADTCTAFVAGPELAAFGPSDQHLDDIATNPAKKRLVLDVVAAIKGEFLAANMRFVRGTRWIVRRFLDAIAASALADTDKRTLERQVLSYLFLNAVGGYVTRAIAGLPALQRQSGTRAMALVMSAINRVGSGGGLLKETVPELVQAIEQMTAEFGELFSGLIDDIRHDQALDDD